MENYAVAGTFRFISLLQSWRTSRLRSLREGTKKLPKMLGISIGFGRHPWDWKIFGESRLYPRMIQSHHRIAELCPTLLVDHHQQQEFH